MFKVKHSTDSARAGELKTSHGNIQSPFFMPVATKGAVKFVSKQELIDFNTQCLISNAFIFYLRPGLDVVSAAGGIHKFMQWEKPLFTDSGGFQLLDENFLIERTEKGVTFNNPFINKKEVVTPEKCMEIQNNLGSDVAMVLDDVPKFGASKVFFEESLKRTTNWAKRCVASHENKKQLIFGIAQGGTFPDLRQQSVNDLLNLELDGLALGGLSIGEPKEIMHQLISQTRKQMPENMPLYVMGLGSPDDVLQAIGEGVDVFDSCFPTQIARHGQVFTHQGRMPIMNQKFEKDFSKLDDKCKCYVCQSFTRAFLHHLAKTKEETGARYLSYHNVYFMQNLIDRARKAIQDNSFEKFESSFLKEYRKNSKN